MANGALPENFRTGMNPTALSLADIARLLSAAGGQRVTVEMIESDVAAGAPTNVDCSINLVQYGAWLVKGMSSRADRPA